MSLFSKVFWLLFAFMYRREFRLPGTLVDRNRGEGRQQLVDRLAACNLVPEEISEERLVFASRSFLSPFRSREITIFIDGEGIVVVRNLPAGPYFVFGSMVMVFLALFELLALSSFSGCQNGGSCSWANQVVVMAGPLLIYGGMCIVYGYDYLFSRPLQQKIVSCLSARPA